MNGEVLRAMARVLSLRGPDDEGFFEQPGISLAHKRLGIIDLTSAARQPMKNETGDLILVFNGEIYNFLELKEKLKKKAPPRILKLCFIFTKKRGWNCSRS